MNSPQDDSDSTDRIKEIRESDDFRNPSPNLAAKLIGTDPTSNIEIEEKKGLESGAILDERHSRRIKHTRHWISVYTAWAVWGAALVAGLVILFVFLWNYLASDELTWLNSEKISDLKFVIGVTSINVAGLYIQWLRSNRVN